MSIPGITDEVWEDTDNMSKRGKGRGISRSPRAAPLAILNHVWAPAAESTYPPPPEYGGASGSGEGWEREHKRSTIPKELQTVQTKDLHKWMLCGTWQTKMQCCSKQTQCPEGLLHRCAFVLADGSFCGGSHHGNLWCPAANNQAGE